MLLVLRQMPSQNSILFCSYLPVLFGQANSNTETLHNENMNIQVLRLEFAFKKRPNNRVLFDWIQSFCICCPRIFWFVIRCLFASYIHSGGDGGYPFNYFNTHTSRIWFGFNLQTRNIFFLIQLLKNIIFLSFIWFEKFLKILHFFNSIHWRQCTFYFHIGMARRLWCVNIVDFGVTLPLFSRFAFGQNNLPYSYRLDL